jgi:hypothetical protein
MSSGSPLFSTRPEWMTSTRVHVPVAVGVERGEVEALSVEVFERVLDHLLVAVGDAVVVG